MIRYIIHGENDERVVNDEVLFVDVGGGWGKGAARGASAN